MKYILFIFILLFSITSCKKQDNSQSSSTTMYFPPVGSTTWETTASSSLNWNQSAIQPLKDFLIQKNTKSFMILVNGRIVMEEYFNGHTASATWQWNSAGKTLTSAITGIAEQEGLLSINDKVTKSLGIGWTNAPILKENLITNRHLLTMTSGLEDVNYVIPANLNYLADAGSRWSYANVFQKLMDVVAVSSKQTFDNYFNTKLKNKLGMDGYWDNGLIFKIYNSNTRSMARFGLLALNNGKWNNEQIINESFFNQSINSSQNINPSYGYFWWLNGKTNYMLPSTQSVFRGTLIPNAPTDMYAAMGAEDNRIFVIPSKKMIVIRMGNASDTTNLSFALSGFDNELWAKINAVIN